MDQSVWWHHLMMIALNQNEKKKRFGIGNLISALTHRTAYSYIYIIVILARAVLYKRFVAARHIASVQFDSIKNLLL